MQGENKIYMKQNQVYGVSRSEQGISMKHNAVYGIRTANKGKKKEDPSPQNDEKKNPNEYDYVDTK